MSKFDDFYSKKPVSELLEKLRVAKTSPATMEREWYDGLIAHLKQRETTTDEKNLFNHILSMEGESLKTDMEVEQEMKRKERLAESKPIIGEGISGRYPVLKTYIGLISFLGYLVILVGTVLLIFWLTKDEGVLGIIAFVSSVVISLPLLAYSNLIQVFIDIEHNTRETKEAITKLERQTA